MIYLFSKIKKILFSDSEPLNGDINKIYETTLETALSIGESNHPNEYIGILEAEQYNDESIVISGINLIPQSFSNETTAVLHSYNIPNSPKYVGTVHSHPNGVLKPSNTDKNSFTKGKIHLILGFPYEKMNWKAYDSNGKPRSLEVVKKENYEQEN